MVDPPLFWFYLFLQFQIFVYLTNHIIIRQHLRWYEICWALFVLVAQAVPTLLLLRAWDFTPAGWPALPFPAKAWCMLAAAWVSWMWLDYLQWRFLRVKPVRIRLLSDRQVRHPFQPPFAWLGWIGIRNQLYDLHAITWEVFLPGWPAAFDGLSVVQVSDVHHNRFTSPQYLHMVREVARLLKPDLYALTGDFVTFDRHIPSEMAWLKGLRAPMGTYAVLGNHDHWSDVGAVKKGLRNAKIRILQNETVTVRRKGKVLALMGVDDIWTGKKEDGKLAGVKADAKILLAHQPDHFPLAKRLGVHLQLSGHTHGGQICFPLIGPLVVPADEGRKYASGFLREGDTTMFINRGIGAFPPIRTLCPPEVVKLILRRG